MPIHGQLLVPTNVDIPAILNSIGYSDRYINDHQDKYNYVLHKILESRVFNKLIAEKHGGYSPLHRETLRQVLGQPYCDNVLRELQEWGIIESDKSYQAGRKSMGYRVTPQYASKAVLRLIFKESFDEKLRRASAAYKAAKTKEHRLVWKHLNQLGINAKEALAYLDTKYDLTDPGQVEQYNADLCAIHKIASEEYFLEQPDPASRIYTNLTNLSKDLRQFLFHKKLRAGLVNLDIRNSQPFMFSLLLKQAYPADLPADVQHYIELTSSGRFYEYMMVALGTPDVERSAFKQEFFAKIFYCRPGYSQTTREGQVFAEHFPGVYAVVNQHKEEAYQNLAIAMQRSEAQIILQEVGRELAAQKVFYATIHDSVVTLEEHAEQVQDLILATFLRKLGIAPTVNQEEFNLIFSGAS